MSQDYTQQHRGSDEAYERYLNGMDKSMRQKVALTAAHLLGVGTVADMGMGSGGGTVALASLYPRMKVVGVDVNPEMVERARSKHVLPNLEFVPGDIATLVFARGSLEAVFDSSVLHHVTSFSGYDHEAAARALAAQVEQLAMGGSLIVRDFVAPAAGEVLLDLPLLDGDESDEPSRCSTGRLFERFAREFRPLGSEPGFPMQPVPSEGATGLREGFRRYRVEHRFAAEFLLRKDYRDDWASEVLEEYTYFTQQRFEAEYAKLGLRLLASFPIHNPWIVRHRFVDRAELRSTDGTQLEFPATNLLIVGEKVSAEDGVRFEAGPELPPGGFLREHSFVHRLSGEARDLVRRPGTSLDVIPWFEQGGSLFVLARKGHPRPILQTSDAAPAVDGGSPVGYVSEPIMAVQSDRPVALTVEDALEKAAAIRAEDIRSLVEVGRYYPSPGGLIEEVRAVHVEVTPTFHQGNVANSTGFSTGGSVRAIDARQLLRAAQVGALPDARLELNVYELLLARSQDAGPWIGDEVTVEEDGGPAGTRLSELRLAPRRSFVPAPEGSNSGFLRLCCRQFTERRADGQAGSSQPREYVLPQRLSTNTVAVALLRRSRGELLIALDEDDLPAVQCFEGSSGLWVTPAWRLPKDVTTRSLARRWIGEQLMASYGVQVRESWELGGRYHPSAGVTPEIVFPLAAAVTVTEPARRPLVWVSLAELVRNVGEFRDGHLRILALRAAHALGVLSAGASSSPR
ncbi:MAG TPA: class I SAM-dependent methyltransferase [Polyangiaceae bacterium]|nr:class I SAM-dependent methyltransferase [Polyangiaceae bacterium]